MPAAIDHPAVREQVRLLYLGNGGNLTLAARTAGIPIDRAEKWKERANPPWDAATDPAAKQLTSLSVSVGKTADNVAFELAEDGAATRKGFSKAARKVAEALPDKSEVALMDKDTAQAAKHWQGIAASTQPGWEQEKKSEGGLVSIALIGLHLMGDKSVQAIEV